jgi:hypothetical protein
VHQDGQPQIQLKIDGTVVKTTNAVIGSVSLEDIAGTGREME